MCAVGLHSVCDNDCVRCVVFGFNDCVMCMLCGF